MINRIKTLMSLNGISAKELTDKLELSNSAITEWTKGKAKPSLDAIIKISNFFHVPIDYIVYGKPYKGALSDDELDLLEAFAKLDRNQKRCVIVELQRVAAKSSAESVTVDLAALSDAPEREHETVSDSD